MRCKRNDGELISLVMKCLSMRLKEDRTYLLSRFPLHISRLERNFKVLKRPARSTDLNHIENLWGMLANKICFNCKQCPSVQ